MKEYMIGVHDDGFLIRAENLDQAKRVGRKTLAELLNLGIIEVDILREEELDTRCDWCMRAYPKAQTQAQGEQIVCVYCLRSGQ